MPGIVRSLLETRMLQLVLMWFFISYPIREQEQDQIEHGEGGGKTKASNPCKQIGAKLFS